MSSSQKKTILWGGFASLLIIGALIGAVVSTTAPRSQAEPPAQVLPAQDDPGDDAVSVKTVLPKHNHEFVRSVTQPVYVQGYHQAELESRVAGPVKIIVKNIGDTVTEGEVLVELDVPDLVQEVVLKEAMIQQVEQDARAAESNIAVVAAQEKEAGTLVRQRQSEVDRAVAKKKFRETEYSRFKGLAENKAVVESFVDEVLLNLETAICDWKTAQVAVDAAKANLEEFAAKLAAVRVDVDVKKSRVVVAKADRDRALTMLNFAKVRAPFNGMIVARRVDPGTFVQNASTGRATALLTIVRTDIVTLVTWVPEKDTRYLKKDTEATIHLDALGDLELRTKITRRSHLLDPEKSRDMRVEVDLVNKDGTLEVGMYGSMKLVLQRFKDAFLVPTSAVFERGGKTYILEVKDGKANLVPVRLQLEDGVQAKIAKLVRQTNPETKQEEIIRQDLTGKEEIIRSGQGEIRDGQEVKSALVEW